MRARIVRILAIAGILASVPVVSPAPTIAQRGHNPFPATPVSGDAPGWRVVEVMPLDIAGRAVSLSPDGTVIAGLDADGALCFWTVADLEQTCAAVAEGPPNRVDPDSIAWAPDSSAVAWSTKAFQTFTDGDIYVVDAASGATSNITDDGLDDIDIFDDAAAPTPVDVMPAWSPDSASVIFSRTVFDDREVMSNELMRVSRDGGEAETIISLAALPGSVFLPMRVLTDGSVLYTVAFTDQGEPANGIWRVSPDGNATQLIEGHRDSAFPIPVINDVWEGEGEIRIVGHSAVLVSQFDSDAPFSFTWSSTTGEAAPLAAGVDETARVYAGAISPDGQTILSLDRSPAMLPVVSLQGPEASQTGLPEFEADVTQGRAVYINATWSDANLVLVSPFLTEAAYLVAVEPAEAGS